MTSLDREWMQVSSPDLFGSFFCIFQIGAVQVANATKTERKKNRKHCICSSKVKHAAEWTGHVTWQEPDLQIHTHHKTENKSWDESNPSHTERQTIEPAALSRASFAVFHLVSGE